MKRVIEQIGLKDLLLQKRSRRLLSSFVAKVDSFIRHGAQGNTHSSVTSPLNTFGNFLKYYPGRAFLIVSSS